MCLLKSTIFKGREVDYFNTLLCLVLPIGDYKRTVFDRGHKKRKPKGLKIKKKGIRNRGTQWDNLMPRTKTDKAHAMETYYPP